MTDQYDCIVLGGGPAGATAATLVAEPGNKVLVLERSEFPRHHVGESLMPQTYWTFKRLGLLDKLKASSFVTKESVQFITDSGKESAPFYFTDRDPNEWSQTWQVRRDEFDQMMLDNAAEKGAEVQYRAAVREVLFDGERAIGVKATVKGESKTYMGRVIVDATGQSGLLSRQLNLRYADSCLKNAAIYSHYRVKEMEPGRNAGATIIMHTKDRNGWFWWIPLRHEDKMVSVGVVAPPSYLCAGRGDDPAMTLEEEIANCPGLKSRLAGAEQVGKTYITADFSYRSKKIAGDGWVLVGDAFGFLDPVYSSGVMLALKSGEYAADSINEALKDGDFSGSRLGAFGPRLVAGMQTIRQLVYAFYNRDFSIGAFVKENPQFGDHIVRILIGDVFNSEVGAVFDAMRERIALPEAIALEEVGATV